jgi:glycerol uptake facilitator-like aquaporin
MVFKPAISTGLAFNYAGASSQLWIYWIGPLVGSVVASSIFWVTNFSQHVYEYGYLR